ncbi:hypothetical protein QA649_08885 [Bradyrhizobium sp. CB1717]|uniref:hypothetical protein n=1 Tax=Bradyrhizobium sp. CB1717 TaxID=3039154 RepID=UPI0024B25119|nr:hypothetical protein [Bradyrhizobium sp. CB1717]WFU26305.1 hypothetical protein QA649_08885 [Bradyrhizobium sp. CB1717]
MDLQMSFEWLSTGRGDPFDFRPPSAMKHLQGILEYRPVVTQVVRAPFYGDRFATVPLIPARADWAVSDTWLLHDPWRDMETILVANDKRAPKADLRAFRCDGDYMGGVGIAANDIAVGVAPSSASIELRSGQLVASSRRITDDEIEISLREVSMEGAIASLQTRPLKGKPDILRMREPFSSEWEANDNDGRMVTILAFIVRIMKDVTI